VTGFGAERKLSYVFGCFRFCPQAVIQTPARAAVADRRFGSQGGSSTAEASCIGRKGLGWRPPPWGSLRLQHRFPLPDLGMQRGSMRTHKPVWFVVLGSTSIGVAMLVGACSHDRIQPAPVLMMGRNGTAASVAPLPAVAPAPAASWRIATAAPAPIVQRPTASPHASSRPAAVRNRSSLAEKARGHRIASHTPARHRSAKIYSAAAPSTSSTGMTRSPAESIPLDEQPATPAARAATPGAAAASPGQTGAAWVSPVPTDDPKPAFRTPSH